MFAITRFYNSSLPSLQRLAWQTSRQFSSGGIAPTRYPNPVSQVVSRIKMPQELSEIMRSHYEDQVLKLGPVSSFKPTKDEHIKNQQAKFQEWLEKFPDFAEQIKQAQNSIIIVIDDVNIPNLEPEKIPASIYKANEIYQNPEIKIAEIMAGLIMSQFIKFEEGQAFDSIFPTQEGADNSTRFDSTGNLLWHNDGWLNKTHKTVALCAINGNQSAITEIITAQQIEDYFKEKDKALLLRKLAKNFILKDKTDDFITNYGPILKDGKVRYSQYGDIKPDFNNKNDIRALSFFRQALTEISPALSIALDNSQILIIKNEYALHARAVKDGATIKPQSRLLLRANAENLVDSEKAITK